MIDKLWKYLETAPVGIPLKQAVIESGLTWYSENGGGCDELVEFIRSIKKYQTKHFIKKIITNKKAWEKFYNSDDYHHLYLLRKTVHTAITMLFGKDSSFSLINWGV